MIYLISLLAYIVLAIPAWYALWYIFRLTAYIENDLFKRWDKYDPRFYVVRLAQWLLILPAAIVIDVSFNLAYGSVWFRQSPLYAFRRNKWFDTNQLKYIFNSLRRLTFTGRLKYNKLYYDIGNKKYDLSIYLCSEWIEPYDEGHCHNNEW